MANARETLKAKLQHDVNARTKFMDSFKQMIREQGLNPDDPNTMRELGFPDVDVADAGKFMTAAESSVVITITA